MKSSSLVCAFLFIVSTATAQDDFSEILAAAQKDPLIGVAAGAFGSGCGTLSPAEAKSQAENSKTFRDAGPAVLPALTYLVSRREYNLWFVDHAAEYATQLPYSEPLRAALRVRREKDYKKLWESKPPVGWYPGIFKYFAVFGDASDLAWMEATVSKLDEYSRTHVVEFIGQLHQKLSSTPPPKA